MDKAGSVFNEPNSDLLCLNFFDHFSDSGLDFNAHDGDWEKLNLLAYYVPCIGEPLGFEP